MSNGGSKLAGLSATLPQFAIIFMIALITYQSCYLFPFSYLLLIYITNYCSHTSLVLEYSRYEHRQVVF